MRKAVVLSVVSLLLIALVTVPLVAAGKAKTHKVMMEGNRFVPEVLTVKSGDTIVWVNRDVVAHTATSAAAKFDSGFIDVGKSWKQTVRTKGDFSYVCTFHPMMTGVLRVR